MHLYKIKITHKSLKSDLYTVLYSVEDNLETISSSIRCFCCGIKLDLS